MDGLRLSSCSMSTIGDHSNESLWTRKDERGLRSSCRGRMYLVSHLLSYLLSLQT